MKVLSATVVATVLSSAVASLSTPEILSQRPNLDKWDGYTYDNFVADFQKKFQSSFEYDARKGIFEDNLRRIKAHNGSNSTWWMTVTQFADMTESEFASHLGRVKPSSETVKSLKATPLNMFKAKADAQASSDLKLVAPESMDNTAHISGIKTQGKCGSCWANAAATSIEAQMHIKFNKRETVSTQQLVACVHDPKHCGGTGGCQGSTEEKAFEYLATVAGITTEEAYPYTAGSGDAGKCLFNSSMPIASKMSGHTILPANNQNSLVRAVSVPFVFTVSVAASSWALYGGGVYTGCTDRKDFVTNHAVVITGYTDDYYQIANSWGDKWGMKGYMYLKRRLTNETCGVNNEPWSGSACDGETDPVVVCGECGILSESTLPFITN